MPIQLEINQGKVPVKVYTADIDASALQQLHNLAQLPFIHSHIAAMPDVHYGIGATVGSVIPMKGAIIPAAVGVDIGCGMNAVRLSLKATDLPDNLAKIRSAIEAKVPVGLEQHKNEVTQAATLKQLAHHLQPVTDKHPGLVKMINNFERTWSRQVGTLGAVIILLRFVLMKVMTCGLCCIRVVVGLVMPLGVILLPRHKRNVPVIRYVTG